MSQLGSQRRMRRGLQWLSFETCASSRGGCDDFLYAGQLGFQQRVRRGLHWGRFSSCAGTRGGTQLGGSCRYCSAAALAANWVRFVACTGTRGGTRRLRLDEDYIGYVLECARARAAAVMTSATRTSFGLQRRRLHRLRLGTCAGSRGGSHDIAYVNRTPWRPKALRMHSKRRLHKPCG